MALSVDVLLETAVALARRGGAALTERWARPHQIHKKGSIDLVTEADRASERAILELLRARHPDHDVVAEESARSDRGSAYCWYIDPLDGTTNYAHGVPHFCVSVGVCDEGGLAA
ncbi:MAG: inositol monophosphatase family protein, partial [Deltaproteobacteria bacterium]